MFKICHSKSLSKSIDCREHTEFAADHANLGQVSRQRHCRKVLFILCASTSHSAQQWLAPPGGVALRKGVVHVWRGIVDIPSSRLQVYWGMLSGDEHERAYRLRFPPHRKRFVAARGMLRSILGFYLNRSPHDIELGIGPQGKPFVQNPVRRKLLFNLSHSQNIVLFAFSHDSEVGIDVEGPKPRLDYHAVAKRVLSPQEQQWLHSLPLAKQKAAFLTCWTRKEAFSKAYGTGLGFPFRDITVTFLPHHPPRVMTVNDPWIDSRAWTVRPVYPRARYAGALVVAGEPHAIHYWDYHQWNPQSNPK